MTEVPEVVKWEDTSLTNLLVLDISLFGTAIILSNIYFFFGRYITFGLVYFVNMIMSTIVDFNDPVLGVFSVGIAIVYAVAIVLAIVYGLYGGLNLLIIRFLRGERVPNIRNDCDYQTFCYTRTKWNRRTNKLLFLLSIVLGVYLGFLVPNFYEIEFDTPLMGAPTLVWLCFAALIFSLPLYRLFLIASDVSYFANLDPTQSMQKTMYLTYIIILSIWNGLLGGLLLYINIKFSFEYWYLPPYLLGYAILAISIIPLIIFVIKYRRIKI